MREMWGRFVGDDDEPNWIACESCSDWFHMHCTDIGEDVEGDELEELQFLCEACL